MTSGTILKASFLCVGLCLPCLASTYSYSGSEAQFTVLESGTYFLLADGGSGGSGSNESGVGYGAQVSGYFYLTAGEVIDIFVGQEGGSDTADGGGGGGGGGTFIALDSSGTPGTLLLAAGGGGGSNWILYAGQNAQTGTSGGTATNSATGGTAGSGGSAGFAGGGGGYLSGGGNGSEGAAGGAGFYTLTGGDGTGGGGNGGYGGGGGADAFGGGGGGGGYSGGGGGGNGFTGPGGGGGSYIDSSLATDTSISVLSAAGDGFAEIETPEPSSLTLMGAALLSGALLQFVRGRKLRRE